ncbi:hypothetical protein AUJ83_01410 [Candidatus Woesearchaeota archaeon CG1_02_33_12]|nr:MAG: hypothetical protein AUJ83_01410 [Candidatus Woesearchaeota archaeon CG1_02_33_12]PIN78279.1 MAG: hypothetical protein COV14_04250 [Candidatus Woesearchaeota archaeon CG10_big_fil_rev_8_21_14_0_10_33_12]PIU72749.1 MAG: hypothetical protein COS79_01310 [Candidatus Woesearchaeota archaeon CG06_land_8_20_14_3_00_33_13]
MDEKTVLPQKCIKNLDEIKEDLSFNKVIDNVIKISNNLKKGERMIIEQKDKGYLATVIKLREGSPNDCHYDTSEGEVKSEYQF